MKKWFVCAALAMAVMSCNNEGNTEGQGSSDTTSPASGTFDAGTGTGRDTTGIDVGAAFPIDSTKNAQPVGEVPGSNKSGLDEDGDENKRNAGGTGAGTGANR